MKSLIIGARGLIGSALKRQIPDAIEGIPVEPKSSTQVYTDVLKYETLFKVFSKHRPDIVYLTAAIAHVDKCENSAGSDAVNVRGATTVLRLCESFGAKLVYFSSSYVFDGRKKEPYLEMDDLCPINHYGEQKKIVEDTIRLSDAKYVIVRTVGVYGTERLKKNFAKQVISGLFSNRKVFVPNDQSMNPILSDHLAKISVQLANKHNGLFHVAGDTCMSKYDFAVQIAKYFTMEGLIQPVKSSEMNQKAIRPVNGCLDCSRIEKLGMLVPSFSGGLVSFLAKEYNG